MAKKKKEDNSIELTKFEKFNAICELFVKAFFKNIRVLIFPLGVVLMVSLAMNNYFSTSDSDFQNDDVRFQEYGSNDRVIEVSSTTDTRTSQENTISNMEQNINEQAGIIEGLNYETEEQTISEFLTENTVLIITTVVFTIIMFTIITGRSRRRRWRL